MAVGDISDRMVVKAYIRYKELREEDWDNHQFPYDILSERTGEPWKVCWRAMERAVDRGYIEYGVSLRTGWPTNCVLAMVKRRGTPSCR